MKKEHLLINRINYDVYKRLIKAGLTDTSTIIKELKTIDDIELISYGAAKQLAYFADINIENLENYFKPIDLKTL